jgi:CO/xanthine dehydrogenase Mo-binding subunit
MNSSGAVANGIGQPVRRKEDFRLLTGRGSFADDVHLAELAHAVIVRSPHAHARIVSVNKSAALASMDVLAVLTGPDYVADGLAHTAWRRAHGSAGCGRAGSRLRADYDPRLPDATRSGSVCRRACRSRRGRDHRSGEGCG